MVRNRAYFFGLTNPVFTPTFVLFFSNRGMELLPMVRNGADFFRTDQSGVCLFSSSFFFLFSPTAVWSCFPWSEKEQIFLD